MVEGLKDPIYEHTVEKLLDLGIKAVIFDLDDTLLETGIIFKKQMQKYSWTVANKTGLEEKQIYARLEEINNDEYEKWSVSAIRWSYVVERLRSEFGGHSVFVENLPELLKIYSQEPKVIPGARDLLRQLSLSGFRLGLVTHANENWTFFKLIMTGLMDYIEVVEIADERGLKTAQNWKNCMEVLEVVPSECLIVGDSLKGDIEPAKILEARAMLVPAVWSVFAQGEVPEGVVMVEKISDFYEGVQRLV